MSERKQRSSAPPTRTGASASRRGKSEVPSDAKAPSTSAKTRENKRPKVGPRADAKASSTPPKTKAKASSTRAHDDSATQTRTEAEVEVAESSSSKSRLAADARQRTKPLGRPGQRPTKLPPARPGRPGGIRARNRDVRVAALLDAGMKLFLERGVESVSIDEIAREAGMAKGNFYRYFDDKRALVDRLLADIAADVRTAMRKCAVALGRAQDPSAMGLAYALLAMELAHATTSRLDVVRLYLQENRAPATPSTAGVRALADELADGAVKLTVAAVDRGLLDVSDPRVSGLAVVGAIEQLALSVLRGQLDAPPLEVGRIVVNMVLDGIRVR
ncbi:MAG: TetR family transcriptional regulator [Myxococcota bacterium]|nr:TetR family transcriptional regulator [Myxococcota bacterium]